MSQLSDQYIQDMEVIASFHSIFHNQTFEQNAEIYNGLLSEFESTLLTHTQLNTLVLISLYIPIFLVAFFGNIIVLLVVATNRHMRSVTNYFIVNLALADILGKRVIISLSLI